MIVSTDSPYFSPIKTRNKRKIHVAVNLEPLPSTSKVATKNITKVEESGICAVKDIEELWEPTNWRVVLENLRKMRVGMDAPVDTMGCHKCADENADDKTRRYHCLVSLMLSSQTKDQVNYEAMSRLKAEALTPQNIIAMDLEKLENLIKPVSFYRVSIYQDMSKLGQSSLAVFLSIRFEKKCYFAQPKAAVPGIVAL